jgi:hypothetical protein
MRCKHCKTKFVPKKFLQKYCLETDECITSFLSHAKEVKAKQQRAKDKKTREGLKTLTELESEAKREFQKWVRLRDKEKPCASCGTNNAKEWHGSHLYSANLYSGLIFDERNVHKCCDYCNVYLHGNLLNFRKGLIERYGKEFVEQLEADSIRLRNYKYTKEQLIEIKNKYKQLNKGL